MNINEALKYLEPKIEAVDPLKTTSTLAEFSIHHDVNANYTTRFLDWWLQENLKGEKHETSD